MQSRTTRCFREAFEKLPSDVKKRARKAFKIWKKNPSHPSLRFKIIQAKEQVYSVRISLGWRAVGTRTGDVMTWFWIGSHAEYEQLISML
ncbi:MAG: hypothetical protein HY707_01700 [Ignavibacteriae bacterium]|nr:hypothetical protein [Ignavibacteriota bacterium]